MRLLVPLPPFEDYSPRTGGAVATVVEALARHWEADGHEVVVLGEPGPEPYQTGTLVPLTYRWPEPKPVRRARLGAIRRLRQYDWPGYPAYVADVRRAVSRWQPDWLLLHNDVVLPAVLRRTLRPTSSLKIGVTLHNSVMTRRLDRAVRTLRDVDLVTAVSAFIAKETEQRFDLPTGRIAVVHNGVDNQLYSGRVRSSDRVALRAAFVGRLLEDKGPQVLLAAAARLRARDVPLEVTVAGSPNFAKAASARESAFLEGFLRHSRDVGARYHSHLSRTEVAGLLAQQDVLVVPSQFDEPFALVVLEGMASGCAVIISRRGGLPEAAGGAALIIEAGDDEGLAQHLIRLHHDHDELRAWQDAGLARAAAKDWRNVAAQYVGLLRPPGGSASQPPS